MAYPTGYELRAFLISNGLIAPNANESLDCDSLIQAAVAQWEGDTGWYPFLGDSETISTRYYDVPDGRLLELESGLLFLSGVSIGGSLLGIGDDSPLFSLFPANTNGKPHTAIKFEYSLCSHDYPSRSIAVQGSWGYTFTLQADVKNAILSLAAMNAATFLSTATGSITQIKQDDVQISYASTTSGNAHYSAVQLQYKAVYDLAVVRYKKGARIF